MRNFDQDQFTVNASDGYPIICHRWRPAGGEPVGRVMVLHGIQSHAGWYTHLAETLGQEGLEVVMPDRRGSGANLPDRGHAASSRRLVEDLKEISSCWNSLSPCTKPPALAGISWGGKLASVVVTKLPGTFSGLALVAPGLFAKVRPPVKTQLAIAVCALLKPKKQFEIPLSDPALFTENPEKQQFIATDPRTLHHATARFFIVSRSMDMQLRRVRRKLNLPVLLQIASEDRIVSNELIRAYVLGCPATTTKIFSYDNAHHTLEFEPEPVATRYALDLAQWAKAVSPA